MNRFLLFLKTKTVSIISSILLASGMLKRTTIVNKVAVRSLEIPQILPQCCHRLTQETIDYWAGTQNHGNPKRQKEGRVFCKNKGIFSIGDKHYCKTHAKIVIIEEVIKRGYL